MVPGPSNILRVLYSLRLDTSEKHGIIIRMEMIGLSSEERDYTVDVPVFYIANKTLSSFDNPVM